MKLSDTIDWLSGLPEEDLIDRAKAWGVVKKIDESNEDFIKRTAERFHELVDAREIIIN